MVARSRRGSSSGSSASRPSLAYIVLWRGVTRLGSFFGDDLYAYTQAADRLAATGSPYHPALLAGPIVSSVDNVLIGYFYPPVLAQLFLPLREIPHLWLAVGLVHRPGDLPRHPPASGSRPWPRRPR